MSIKMLVIGAHPDDIELGLGGGLARYVEEGKKVYALILSRGEKGVRENILFYESLSTRTSFSPNYFVDISYYIDKKVEALKMHKTQEGKPYMDEEVIKAKARFRGFQAKVKYAKGFVIGRMVTVTKALRVVLGGEKE